MIRNYTKNPFSIARLLCATFGHNFKVSQKITEHITEYECSCCREERTINANGDLEILTPQYKETNAYLAQIHKRRSRRILSQAS